MLIMEEKQITNVITELRKHSPEILDETGDCFACNGMIQLSKMIDKFP